MSRFYTPKDNIHGNRAEIRGREAHHILDVMRLRDGDRVVVFDGTGTEYTGFISSSDARKSEVSVEIVKTDSPPAGKGPYVALAQALPKKGKMDNIVEKATELGVSLIIPVVTARTIVRPSGPSSAKKKERWEKIATASAKQCGRADIPSISAIEGYDDVIGKLDEYDLVLFASLTGRNIPLKEALSSFAAGRVLILIGPEGDFTPEEVAAADADNCIPVSLGKRVLKSDTAGIFVLSAINYELAL